MENNSKSTKEKVKMKGKSDPYEVHKNNKFMVVISFISTSWLAIDLFIAAVLVLSYIFWR